MDKIFEVTGFFECCANANSLFSIQITFLPLNIKYIGVDPSNTIESEFYNMNILY
jgi:hypothetical protein